MLKSAEHITIPVKNNQIGPDFSHIFYHVNAVFRNDNKIMKYNKSNLLNFIILLLRIF